MFSLTDTIDPNITNFGETHVSIELQVSVAQKFKNFKKDVKYWKIYAYYA